MHYKVEVMREFQRLSKPDWVTSIVYVRLDYNGLEITRFLWFLSSISISFLQ